METTYLTTAKSKLQCLGSQTCWVLPNALCTWLCLLLVVYGISDTKCGPSLSLAEVDCLLHRLEGIDLAHLIASRGPDCRAEQSRGKLEPLCQLNCFLTAQGGVGLLAAQAKKPFGAHLPAAPTGFASGGQLQGMRFPLGENCHTPGCWRFFCSAVLGCVAATSLAAIKKMPSAIPTLQAVPLRFF